MTSSMRNSTMTKKKNCQNCRTRRSIYSFSPFFSARHACASCLAYSADGNLGNRSPAILHGLLRDCLDAGWTLPHPLKDKLGRWRLPCLLLTEGVRCYPSLRPQPHHVKTELPLHSLCAQFLHLCSLFQYWDL